MVQKPLIEIIAVTYQQPGPLKVLVQCFLNQTADNWKLVVIHDGPDAAFDALMSGYADRRISHWSTPNRFNDWGHSLRDMGLKKARGDFVLLTNGDNYYVPQFVALVTKAIDAANPDLVIFNLLSHYTGTDQAPLPPYSLRSVELEGFRIDIGAAVVRTRIARTIGFRGREAWADATYFEDLRRHSDLVVVKLPSCLLVHN